MDPDQELTNQETTPEIYTGSKEAKERSKNLHELQRSINFMNELNMALTIAGKKKTIEGPKNA